MKFIFYQNSPLSLLEATGDGTMLESVIKILKGSSPRSNTPPLSILLSLPIQLKPLILSSTRTLDQGGISTFLQVSIWPPDNENNKAPF